MRILVLSDIHANLTALEAVLASADGRWEAAWFLGDLVGYGPDPEACVARLREMDALCLSGNHDWAVLGKLDMTEFNPDARKVVDWTRECLSAEALGFLEAQPPMRVEGPFTLAHASPRHPVWEYILDLDTALDNFAHLSTPYCFVGHSHLPLVYALDEAAEEISGYVAPAGEVIDLGPQRLILNPGSVGQPRDGDPRAAYALLDTEAATWEYVRVPYDIPAVQERMRDLRFPNRLIRRLADGM
jgi:diadenosine tetraphosphatase ApaH/serine/threonine PP2A family protein phosphatase